MPGLVYTDLLFGAVDYNGTAGLGLFDWDALNGIPLNTRILITSLAYATEAGSPGNLACHFRPQTVFPTPDVNRMIAAQALEADIIGPTGAGDIRFCGILVPRSISGHWRLHCVTTGKQVNGQISVDWVIVPYPDTDERDQVVT